MNKPWQIGITGGIGSGKSLICKIFMALGTPVYDADSRAKWLQTHDLKLIGDIKRNFGADSYLEDNTINRTYLAEIVFKDQEKLALLNQLVHPQVAHDYQQWVNQHAAYHYVIKEAALLFESGSNKSLDKIINVNAPVKTRMERVLLRDSFRSEAQVREIMARQLTDPEREKRADFTIKNDNQALVIPQVLAIHRQFTLPH